MDFDRIKFVVRPTQAGFVVVEERYAGSSLVSTKELGMVHARKEDAIKALDSLFILTRQTSAGKRVESEVL
jgi:hypothetical protein